MNLNLMRKRNLTDQEDLIEFLGSLNLTNKLTIFGPMTQANEMYEMLESGDESFSVQVWLTQLVQISAQISSNVLHNNQAVLFILMIENVVNVFKELKDDIKTIEYMKSIRKWHNTIFSNMNDRNKITIYAVEYFLQNKLKDIIEYAPFSQFIDQENKKIRTLTKVQIEAIKNITGYKK